MPGTRISVDNDECHLVAMQAIPNLIEVPNNLDRESSHCRVIVETPRNRRSKFAYDPETNLFEMKSLLPAGMMFPFDFGFIPQTLGEDGDPLDILVMMDESAHVGCLLTVRIIGVIEAEQTRMRRPNATTVC